MITSYKLNSLDALLHGDKFDSLWQRELFRRENARREAEIEDFLISGAMLRDLCQVESAKSRTLFMHDTFDGWLFQVATDWRIN